MAKISEYGLSTVVSWHMEKDRYSCGSVRTCGLTRVRMDEINVTSIWTTMAP